MIELRWMVLFLLPACFIASRDNLCDPAAESYTPGGCEELCRNITCGEGAGPVFTASDGCNCVVCEELVCPDRSYRVGCGCLPMYGESSCVGSSCTLSCDAGHASCDGSDANGCETDPTSNPEHCGGCGKTCGGAECVGGECRRLLLGSFELPSYPQIVADEGFIYFVTQGSTDDILVRVPLGGGATLPLAPGDFPGLTLDGDQVYWADPIEKRVRRVAKTGGNYEDLVSGEEVLPQPVAIAGDEVLWTTKTSQQAALRRAKKTGGSASTVVLIEAPVRSTLRSLQVSRGYVYWIDNPQIIKKALLPAGEDEYVGKIYSPFTSEGLLAVGDAELYVAVDAGLFRLPLGVVDPEQERLDDGFGPVGGLAVDATDVYWLASSSLRRVDKTTHRVTVVENAVLAMATNERFLFYLNEAKQLWQLRK